MLLSLLLPPKSEHACTNGNQESKTRWDQMPRPSRLNTAGSLRQRAVGARPYTGMLC